MKETVQIEVIFVRPDFHVNISEQFTIHECIRPSFEGSVNMDLSEDVDEDDYLRKEVSCSKTNSGHGFRRNFQCFRGFFYTTINLLLLVKIHKAFAYYILVEQCIPEHFMEHSALGNSRRCDVYVNSFRDKCQKTEVPKHVTYLYDPSTSWTTGRNKLYAIMKSTGKDYYYHIFLDDDVVPFYTESIIRHAKNKDLAEGSIGSIELFEDFINDPNGLKEAIYQETNGKSAWRTFEDDLLIHSPAFAVTNLLRLPDGFESRLMMQKHWVQMCSSKNRMPWIVPTVYLDECFIAYHREALPLLLPYTEKFEHISWHLSGILQVFRARALMYRQGIANYKVSVLNKKHRPYPRGFRIPDNLLLQYFEADGKDIKNTIDDREHNYKPFNSWSKWEETFIHDPKLCAGPIRFPIWRHYNVNGKVPS